MKWMNDNEMNEWIMNDNDDDDEWWINGWMNEWWMNNDEWIWMIMNE